MIELALKSLDTAMDVRDALLIGVGLFGGVLLWQVEEMFRRVRDRGGRRGR